MGEAREMVPGPLVAEVLDAGMEIEIRLGTFCDVRIWREDPDGVRRCLAEEEGYPAPDALPDVLAAAVAQSRIPLTPEEEAAHAAP